MRLRLFSSNVHLFQISQVGAIRKHTQKRVLQNQNEAVSASRQPHI